MGSPWEPAEASNQALNLADPGNISITVRNCLRFLRGFLSANLLETKRKSQSWEKGIGHIQTFHPHSSVAGPQFYKKLQVLDSEPAMGQQGTAAGSAQYPEITKTSLLLPVSSFPA